MNMPRSLHRLAAWIACCAVLMAALAPSISQAIAVSRQAAAADVAPARICSAAHPFGAGAPDFPAAAHGGHDDHDGSSPSNPGHDGHAAHCPFCLVHAGWFGLPPPEAAALPAIAETVVRIPIVGDTPRQRSLRCRLAQSRAPPLS